MTVKPQYLWHVLYDLGLYINQYDLKFVMFETDLFKR